MSGKKPTIEKKVEIRNREASHNYHLLDSYTAGIVLTGTEIKAIRQSKVNLTDAYCQFRNGELYVVNMLISPYEKGTHYNHSPRADRKLLLKRSELARLLKGTESKGFSIVPTRLFIGDKGWAKLNIALAQGKKLFDKREDIKARDIEREMRRGE